MTGNGKIGVALVGGYLLGRTKKAKMAIGLGMFLAGKKLSFDPAQLGKLVANSPVLGSLNTQVRKELVEATKSAATSALTKRASGLADSLHERTLGLDDPDGKKGRDEDAEDEPEDDEEQDPAAEDEDQDEKDDKPAPRRRPAAKSASGKASSGARRGTSGGRKTASSARKTTSGTRKTASRTRTTKNGGGRDE